MQTDALSEKLSGVRQEADGSITAACPICETEGHPNKRIKLYIGADGRITGIGCVRFASAGTDANREHCKPIREMLGLKEHREAFVSSVLFEGDRQVTIEIEPVNKGNATQFVTARNCTSVLHSAEMRLGRPDDRAAFVVAIPDRTESERESLLKELVQLLDRFRKARAAVDDSDGGAFEPQSAATRLVALTEKIQLIHNADGDGFALMMIDGHKETWPLRSKGFKQWLQRQFYEQYEKAPGSQAVADAIGVIEGKAVYDGPERKIFIRIGEMAGKIYLDLADDQWRAVEIDADGWRVVAIPPIEFKRAKGMLPLPVPEAGGSLDKLKEFVNFKDGDLWTLLRGSLVMKFHPRGPYNADLFFGEQGCGKTTRARIVRALVDPSVAPTRGEPHENRDLQVAALNEWLPIFDNMSRIPAWLSDALCCLSTGGGFRKRENYTDTDEVIFSTKRPFILTSITEVAERPDLLDRLVLFNLPAIEKKDKKPEKKLWAEFEEARPGILGALLDGVSCAVKNEDSVEIKEASRMADFERWAEAAAPKLGLKPGEFIRAYIRNQKSSSQLALDASPITEPIILLAQTKAKAEKVEDRKWTGTAKELMTELATGISEEEAKKRREQGWPKTPKDLSSILRRLAPNLRSLGVYLDFDKRSEDKRRVRQIEIEWREPPKGEDDPPPPEPRKTDDGGHKDCLGKSASSASNASAQFFGGENRGLTGEKADALDFVSASANEKSASAIDRLEFPAVASRNVADALDALFPTNSYEGPIISLDTETEPFDPARGITSRTAKMVGMSVSYDGDKADYVTDHDAWPMMMPEPDQTVIFHNAKFDMMKLSQTGLTPPAKWEDTMIAAHLLDETGEHGLKPLAKEFLGIDDPITFEEAERMRMLDPGMFDEYAKNDARYTFRLWPMFRAEMAEQELMPVYELEKAVVPAVLAMEAAGMKIDLARMSEMRQTVMAEADGIEAEIYDHAGCRFDLHSPQKTATILFDKLGVPSVKETNGGQRSVDKEALEDVRGHHPAVDGILRYREIDKLASTFLSVLPKFADARGRIHPEFKPLGATSGRFSCANPNVQQIPSRSELGKKLRQMFVADDGNVLVVADWSQMELRILAQYSKDPLLLEAYSGTHETDLHILTASRMFGKPEADVTKQERTVAKMINFGIAYGITSVGLFNRLRPQGVEVTQEDCERFIRDYFKTYAGVKKFLGQVESRARQRGFVKNWFGRRRRVSGHTSREVRQAQNFVIQSTAADMAKTAMVKLHSALPDGARLIAMVHDEFIVECLAEMAEDVRGLMVETMQVAPEGFIVPMVVEAKIGGNWGEAK